MILDLINNVTLLLALSLLYSFLMRYVGLETLGGKALLGLIFGITSIIVMMIPFDYRPGVIFDGRSILAAMSGLFGGTLPALITAGVASAYRFSLGGTGAWTGVGVIVTSCILGLLYRALSRKHPKIMGPAWLYLFGVAVHVCMLLWMLTLPQPLASNVLSRISLPVMIIFPLATVLLGFLLSNSAKQLAMEKALRASEEKYRQLIETANEGVWMIDENFRTTFVNRKMAEMLGCPPEEIIGFPANDFIAEDEISDHKDKMMVRQRGESSVYERRFFRKDGQPLWAMVSATPMVDEDGTFKGSFAMLSDVTNRKRAEDELRKSEQRLRQLHAHVQNAIEKERISIARDIHDDLAQMLTAFKMDLVWLKKRLTPHQTALGHKIDTMAEQIKGTVKTVKRICYELRPGILDELGLVSALEWYVAEFRKRHEMDIQLLVEPADFKADRLLETDLYRIVQEALTNVIKHAGPCKTEILLKQNADGILLVIQDKGPGIMNEEDLEGPGSFGIMGMRERVYAHRGQFEISGRRGEGTVIRASIPTAEEMSKGSA